MKKTAFIIAFLTAGFVASAGEVNIATTPLPAPAPLPPAPAAAPAPVALEIGGVVNFATRNILNNQVMGGDYKTKVDTYGVDLTAVYGLDSSNALTLRFGYSFGDEIIHMGDNASETFTLNTFYLMPGYRFTTGISDGINFFAGANIGLINHSLKEKDRYYANSEWDFAAGYHDSAWGFAYSAEVGVTFDLCENTYLLVAYQLSGSSAKPKINYAPEVEGATVTARKQYYQTVRVGVGIKF